MNIDESVRTSAAAAAGDAAARVPRRSRSATVVALQARALAHESFQASASAVVAELALLLQCERVSIGFRQHGRTRVGAMSCGSVSPERRNLARAIAAAMDEALDQRATIVHPLPPDSSLWVTLAHAELARLDGRASICTVSVFAPGGSLGALVFERRDAFDALAVEIAKDAASFVGPLLELKHRLEQPLAGRLVDAMSARSPSGRPDGRVLGAAAASLALTALALWPVTERVVAPARVESSGQRQLAAPVDGFVHAAPVRPGDAVRAGQLLVALENRDLGSERDKWSAEAAQLDKQYREALTQDEAAPIVIARAKLDQARSQLELVEHQLERARIVAPFDGVVLAGDLSQSLGMPVKRGQELLTVAPDKSFRVVAEVDEQDVARLRENQPARVMFGALVERPYALTITRIAPAANPVDGRNVFEVDARVDAAAGETLRPGLRGVVHIDIGEARFGAVWWQRAASWARRQWWRLLG